MANDIDAVLERLPAYADAIRRLAARNPGFSDACQIFAELIELLEFSHPDDRNHRELQENCRGMERGILALLRQGAN